MLEAFQAKEQVTKGGHNRRFQTGYLPMEVEVRDFSIPFPGFKETLLSPL